MTRRDLHAAAAGRSGRTDLSELLSERDFGGALVGERARLQARSEVEVYVMELNLSDGSGWTSVHRTYEGARRRLEQKVDELGLREEFNADQAGEVVTDHCTAAGEEGALLTYGISRLPVED